MDTDIEELLESWQLSSYKPTFAENKITVETLSFLDSDLIKELIKPIGDRVRFSRNLAQWKENEHEPKLPKPLQVIKDESPPSVASAKINLLHNFIDKSEPSVASAEIKLPHNFKYINLENLLKQNLEGRALLNFHSESGLLSSKGRRKICNIIVKHLLEIDQFERITSATLLTYAQQITTLFKQENNRRREYRETQNSSTDNIEETNNTSTAQMKLEFGSEPTAADFNENIEWLKSSCHPWGTVIEKWRKTTEYRCQELMEESYTTHSYLYTYPALQKPAGFHLLLYDFAHQFPENTAKLADIFPLHKEKILDLAVNKFSKHPDEELKNFTIEYIMNIDDCEPTSAVLEETKAIYGFLFLPLLLKSHVCRNNKKTRRSSKIEARDAFITHVEAEKDLYEVIIRRKEKHFTLGLTFHPSIFIVGPSIMEINKYYVLVNDICYVVSSIVEAVDVTFKLFYSLNCKFPTECYTVYSFIQKAFYKISTKWDKEFTTVNSLLADLNIK